LDCQSEKHFCNERINVSRHHEKEHEGKYKDFIGKLRKNKIKNLKSSLPCQQNIFKKQSMDRETIFVVLI
jgi:hypothetical protein